jgi:predicted Zn-dependent protease
MEVLYKGRFFNGRTTRAYIIDCTIKDKALHLFFEDGSTAVWPVNEIKCREVSRNFISLQYGTHFPFEQLDVTDKEFIKLFTKTAGVKRPRSSTQRTAPIILGLLGLILFGLWAAYVWLFPMITDMVARKVPISYEESMGQDVLRSVIDVRKIDRKKTKVINEYFKQLDINTPYKIKITVVNEPVVNAFALPGGQIVVYTGILKKMNSHEQLAALLAHEFSHVQMRHATRNIFRNLSGYIILSLIIGDMGGVTGTIMQHAEKLTTLSYSRKLEQEADEQGMEILKHNQIDVSGMRSLFEMLKEDDANDVPKVSELISTHPDLDKRIEAVNDFMSKNDYTPREHKIMQNLFTKLKK